MGQAKLRKLSLAPTVYHHTSVLRTNEIWMSGVIAREGEGKPAMHPQLGEVSNSPVTLRRPMQDFPALAWFTSRIEVPRCLSASVVAVTEKGERIALPEDVINALAMARLAIGFPAADIPVIPWSQHYGYHTAEGKQLNEDAREVGDNPDEWWVSEEPVDLLKSNEIWIAKSFKNTKLVRQENYLADVKRMVTLCRENPTVYIPPSWMRESEALALAKTKGSSVSIAGR